MPKKESANVTTTRISTKGQITIAAITVISTLIVGYWQFALKPQQPQEAVALVYAGRVVDKNNQMPIPGAEITFYLDGIPQFTYTDSEGLYQFIVTINTISSGQIRVDAQGYQTYTRNITLSSSPRNVDDIRLTALSSISISETATNAEVNTTIASPIPVATSSSATTIFEDTFIDNKNNWNTTSSYPFIGAGKYSYSLECPSNYNSYFCGTYIVVPFVFPNNFQIEIDFTIEKSSPNAQVALGFQFRRNDRNLYYINYFISDMYYVLRSAYNTNDMEIIPKASTDLIAEDIGATNRLGIKIQDSKFTPIINGYELLQGEDGNMTEAGDTYLVIFVARGHSALIHFDNLLVQEVK